MTALGPPADTAAGHAVGARGGRSRLPVRLFGLALGLVLCGLTALRVDLRAAVDAARGAAVWSVLGSVALGVPVVVARSLRTRILLGSRGLEVGLRRLTTTQLVGLTLSGITPGGTGDLVRAWAWRDDGVPVRTGVAVVAVERVASLLFLVGLGAICIAPTLGAGVPVEGVVAIAGVAVCALPWLVGRAVGPWAVDASGRRRSVRALLTVAQQAHILLGSGRVAAGFTLTTLAAFAFSGLQLVLLAAGTGSHLDLGGAVAVYCLGNAAGSLSGLPFGLGATEAASVGLLTHLGVSPAGALAVALLSRLTVTVPQTLAAALVLAWTPLGRARPAPAVDPVPE